MANGLLGKKVVGSRDTEVVYTVPASRTATMNVNIVNNGSETGNVFLYVSDKDYQAADFEDYKPLDNSWTLDAEDYLDIVGFDQSSLMATLKNTSRDVTNTGTVDVEVTRKISVDNTAGTMTVEALNAAQNGMPLPFLDDTDWYVRSANNGSTYTLANFLSNGSAQTSANTWGQDATDNNRWATNVDGKTALCYVNGTPASGSTTVSFIADYRRKDAATYTNTNWAAGAISSCAGIKTTGEYFLTGVVFGTVYISSDGNPTTTTMLQNSQFSLSAVSAAAGGIMVGAAASEGASAGSGYIYMALSSDKVIYSTYDGTTAVSSTTSDWEYSFDFPAGVTWEDLVDVRSGSAANELLLVTDKKVYRTVDLGVTWTNTPNAGTMPYKITVAADAASVDKYNVNGIFAGEVELIRGRTYRFYVHDSTVNSHPFLFSATKDGTHATGGAAYDTGVTYYLGDPDDDGDTTQKYDTASDYTTNFATYNGQVKFVEVVVASDAPDTLYTYCHTHSGMGFTVNVADAPTTAPNDDETIMVAASIWATASGDVTKKFDLFKNGETYSREKRFFELPEVDLYDKAGLGSGALLERTAIMASAGEQIIVKTSGENVVVRVHGIEE
jgi:hypothetical protein